MKCKRMCIYDYYNKLSTIFRTNFIRSIYEAKLESNQRIMNSNIIKPINILVYLMA